MVITSSKAVKKMIYDQNLRKYFTDYTQILVVGADNLSANQLRNIRQGLKTDCDAVLLMGKDSMMKNAITTHAQATGKAAFLGLVPHLAGRVGLVFTKGDINYLNEVSEIVANKYKRNYEWYVGLNQEMMTGRIQAILQLQQQPRSCCSKCPSSCSYGAEE